MRFQGCGIFTHGSTLIMIKKIITQLLPLTPANGNAYFNFRHATPKWYSQITTQKNAFSRDILSLVALCDRYCLFHSLYIIMPLYFCFVKSFLKICIIFLFNTLRHLKNQFHSVLYVKAIIHLLSQHARYKCLHHQDYYVHYQSTQKNTSRILFAISLFSSFPKNPKLTPFPCAVNQSPASATIGFISSCFILFDNPYVSHHKRHLHCGHMEFHLLLLPTR